MRFLIFGAGRFYENRKAHLHELMVVDTCIGFLDNQKTGQVDGLPVYAPAEGIRLPYDAIILMSSATDDMREQLVELGVKTADIWAWDVFQSYRKSGILHIYPGKAGTGKRILIVTEMLQYNGGALAAVYAGLALQTRGCDVSLATTRIDQCLLQEVSEQGLTVIDCPVLPRVFSAERLWMKRFDIVLVNVFPMVASAVAIDAFRPILWWIHDPSELYPWTCQTYAEEIRQIERFSGRILAVSSIAERIFLANGGSNVCDRMPYGIPDIQNRYGKNDGKICFALIGYINERKGQDILLQAIAHLSKEMLKTCSFLIIGFDSEDEYSKKLRKDARAFPNVEFTGVLSRREMNERFRTIDVVVCPSREDPLPIVVTEGFMHRKICIASDATGQGQDMIEDGVNGFVCKAGNTASLAEKMQYVIEHFDELDSMREKARETYERYFSMEAFGERLERELLLTEKEYWERKKQDE